MRSRRETANQLSVEGIFSIVEEMPDFPGGMKGLRNYVYSHLDFPADKAKELSGTALVGFMVTHEGKFPMCISWKSTNRFSMSRR